jgi:hypothetical protein
MDQCVRPTPLIVGTHLPKGYLMHCAHGYRDDTLLVKTAPWQRKPMGEAADGLSAIIYVLEIEMKGTREMRKNWHGGKSACRNSAPPGPPIPFNPL